MIEFRILNANPLYDYKEACKTTQGLDLRGAAIDPLKDEFAFWVKQIIANHSTIRCVKFRMKATASKSVIMQVIRATKGHPQPYVQSSRPDWNGGKPRSTDPYEEKLFCMDFTAESFIEICKQRMCKRTEDKTRAFINNAVKELLKSDNPFLKAVGSCCHPNCWWLNGCPEIKGCKDKPKVSDRILN